jgi:hypothetical protein
LITTELFSVTTPELEGAVGAFLGVLVDTIASAVSPRMTTALYKMANDRDRMRRVVGLLSMARSGSLAQPIVTVAERTEQSDAAGLESNAQATQAPEHRVSLLERPGTLDTDFARPRQVVRDPWEEGIERAEREAHARGISVEELGEKRLREVTGGPRARGVRRR